MPTEAEPVQRWSTDDVPAHDRLDLFVDALASAVLPMRMVRAPSNGFDMRLATANLGPVGVVELNGCDHRVIRRNADIERSSDEVFHLLLNLTAPCHLIHQGEVFLGSGDATLVDSRLPHDFELGAAHHHIHLRLSHAWLRQWVPTPALLVGRSLPKDSGWAAALTALVSQLTPDFIAASPLPGSMLADQVGAMLTLIANELGGASVKPTPPARDLVSRIRERIVERAVESSLCAADVAASLDISVRTLHRALAGVGATFGMLLMAARADAGRRMLESAAMRRLTTEEIGRRSGFLDASHFARVMRATYGRTPMQIRKDRGRSDVADRDGLAQAYAPRGDAESD